MRCLYLLLAACLLSACAAVPDLRANRPEPIAAATAAWQAAYDSRNPARITALYEPEAVLWGTTAKTIASTPAAIADYFKSAPSRPNARVTLGEQHIRVYGDVAVNSGYYTFSDVQNGQSSARPSRFTIVFRNIGGNWMIATHHSSSMP
jgi:uncharacterized protein (TIGR02246 family)